MEKGQLSQGIEPNNLGLDFTSKSGYPLFPLWVGYVQNLHLLLQRALNYQTLSDNQCLNRSQNCHIQISIVNSLWSSLKRLISTSSTINLMNNNRCGLLRACKYYNSLFSYSKGWRYHFKHQTWLKDIVHQGNGFYVCKYFNNAKWVVVDVTSIQLDLERDLCTL